MASRLYLDGTTTGGTTGIGPVTILYWITQTPPTVCGYPERRDTGYYCIRATGHSARHRYGKAIEGTFKAREYRP